MVRRTSLFGALSRTELVTAVCCFVILLIGCQDDLTRLAPERTGADKVDAAVQQAPDEPLSSTVCQAYRGRLSQLEEKLVADGETPEAHLNASGLREIVDDICR